MALEEERSLETRARAETALVRFLHELGENAPAIIVLGGLVPPILAEGVDSAPPHIGTADVDVLLITHVDESARLGAVERALLRMRFEPADDEGWRWRGRVDGHVVRIEFLCDLEEYAEGALVRPPESTRLAASNLRGTGYVARDFETRALKGTLTDGSETVVSARFAGLGGYLLSKLVAVRTRAATKDYYDFIYVLINNSTGGPAEAARVLREGPLSDAVRALHSTLVEVRERFRRTADFGPQQYADQSNQAAPGSDIARLRADAVSAAQEFFEPLLEDAS